MRSAARMPADEPEPERADLDAKAAALLDGHAALIGRAQAILAAYPDPRTAPLIRQLVTEIIAAGLHFEELRGEIDRYVVVNAALEHAFQAGIEHEQARAAAAAAAVPAPRGHRRAPASRGWQQRALSAVKVLIPAGGVVVLGRIWSAHKLAAAATGIAATAGLTAAVTLGPSSMLPFSGPSSSQAGSAPGLPASGSPFPSSSPIALLAVHPKTKERSDKGKSLLGEGVMLPCCYESTEPSSSPSSVSPLPASSGPVVRPQLTVSTSAIDLTAGPAATAAITLSATGGTPGSWVAWRVDAKDPATGTDPGDLDFSATGGVLLAGQSATVTVSVDPAQAADGDLSEVFSIDGQQITADLPVPVPVVTPTAAASVLPSVLPSDTPSPGSS